MMLRKNCLAVALSAAAAAFVSASAQTVFEGAVQPAVPASQPVVHAVPLSPAASAPEPTQKPAEKPAAKPPEKPPEKPAQKPAHRRVHGPTRKAAPQPAMQPAPPMLPAPTSHPAEQPAPASQPYAQPAPAPQPYAQPAVQPVVNWTLQVIRDGQQVDSFDGTTPVGQARTNRHHKIVTHKVGCNEQPAGSIDLQRTITVVPLRADPTGSVLAIEAQETLESDTTPTTRAGCKLPPQPSQVHARHPGLVVPAGQWVNWQIVGQDPSLLYRVRASLAPPSVQP